MPAMSGIDLAKRLRNRHVGTPIILITGYPDENIEEKAAAAGIRHVLLKPHLEENLVKPHPGRHPGRPGRRAINAPGGGLR